MMLNTYSRSIKLQTYFERASKQGCRLANCDNNNNNNNNNSMLIRKGIAQKYEFGASRYMGEISRKNRQIKISFKDYSSLETYKKL